LLWLFRADAARDTDGFSMRLAWRSSVKRWLSDGESRIGWNMADNQALTQVRASLFRFVPGFVPGLWRGLPASGGAGSATVRPYAGETTVAVGLMP